MLSIGSPKKLLAALLLRSEAAALDGADRCAAETLPYWVVNCARVVADELQHGAQILAGRAAAARCRRRS